VCVILVTFITTIMVSLVAIIIWRLPIFVVAIGFIAFGALDGVYLTSALTKVPSGAWFTIVLASVLSSIFVLWRFGKENQWRAEASDRIPPSQIISSTEDGVRTGPDGHQGLRLTPAFGGAVISSIHGMGIFFDKTGSSKSTPTVFIHFLRKFQAAPAVVVFFHIRPLSVPTVPPAERFTVTRSFLSPNMSPAFHDFYRVTLRHGYTDEAVTRDLGLLLLEQLRAFAIREQSMGLDESPPATLPMASGTSASSTSPISSSEPRFVSVTPQALAQDLARQHLHRLQSAYDHQVVFVVGKEQMRIREDQGLQGWTRRIALSAFLWLRENTGSRVRNLNVDVEKLVEIGFVKVV
jgi:KUP system potassium uptake protein